MASVYTNEAAVALFVAGAGYRLTALLDRNRDGTADTGVLDATIGNAGTEIDARLAQRYDVPFAQITDSPDTPDIIQLIAKNLVAAELYAWAFPDGNDAKAARARADSMLDKILSGDFAIPDVAPLGGGSGRVIISYDADEPQFSGRDSSDVRRWRGL